MDKQANEERNLNRIQQRLFISKLIPRGKQLILMIRMRILLCEFVRFLIAKVEQFEANSFLPSLIQYLCPAKEQEGRFVCHQKEHYSFRLPAIFFFCPLNLLF